MTGDSHYRLIRSLRFSKLGDRVMPQIVEAQAGQGALQIPNVGSAFSVGASLSGLLERRFCWKNSDGLTSEGGGHGGDKTASVHKELRGGQLQRS
jgi:hypothetical protein